MPEIKITPDNLLAAATNRVAPKTTATCDKAQPHSAQETTLKESSVDPCAITK